MQSLSNSQSLPVSPAIREIKGSLRLPKRQTGQHVSTVLLLFAQFFVLLLQIIKEKKHF